MSMFQPWLSSGSCDDSIARLCIHAGTESYSGRLTDLLRVWLQPGSEKCYVTGLSVMAACVNDPYRGALLAPESSSLHLSEHAAETVSADKTRLGSAWELVPQALAVLIISSGCPSMIAGGLSNDRHTTLELSKSLVQAKPSLLKDVVKALPPVAAQAR